MSNVFISSEIGSQWQTILGHPQLIECMGICFEPGAWTGTEGFRHYLHIVKKKKNWKFLFKFSQGTCPWKDNLGLDFFLGIFLKKIKGGL